MRPHDLPWPAAVACLALIACGESHPTAIDAVAATTARMDGGPASLPSSPPDAAPRRWSGAARYQLQGPDRWLGGAAGSALLKLRPALVVVSAPSRVGPWTRRNLNLTLHETRRADGWQLRGEAELDVASYSLQIAHRYGEPELSIRLRVLYKTEALFTRELLSLETAPQIKVHALDRAYRQVEVTRAHHLGGFSVRQLLLQNGAARASLGIGAGFEGLAIYPRPKGALVQLELTHGSNHPLWVQRRCRKRWSRRRRLQRLRGRFGCPGLQRTAEATLLLGPSRPLQLGRLPRGRRAALVFTDHADQSSAARLEAFAFGATGALRVGRKGRRYSGFVNRGLSYLKTIFVESSRGYPPQLSNPHYLALVKELQQAGVEIGLHSVSGASDPPARVLRLLQQLEQRGIRATTWVDHQPDTNCEAISCRGWDARGQWYLLPTLAEHGVRYLWNGLDLPWPRGSSNQLAPGSTRSRRPVFYSAAGLTSCDGADRSLWLFSSMFAYLPRVRLLQQLSRRRIDRLVQEHGVMIAHVYLDSARQRGRHRSRSLLREVRPGSYVLRAEVDRLFRRLARRQLQGKLWVTGITPLFDHWLAGQQLELRYLSSGQVQLINRSPRPLQDLTLFLQGRAVPGLLRGPLTGWRQDADSVVLWLTLGPHQAKTLSFQDEQGKAVPLAAPVEVMLQ